MRPLPLLSLIVAGLVAAPPGWAQQVNRCTGAQGQTVYSDRRCEDLGATARLPAAARDAGGNGLYRDSCARRLSDLVAQINSAVQARDVNRLSSVYLWNGLSNAAAARVLDRLEAIVQRPLVDIAPVFAEAPAYQPAAALPFTYSDGTPVDPGAQPAAPAPAADNSVAYRRPRPIGLRLEQTLGNGSTPSRTVLGLRRQYNCFWISL
ncbi:DUF4124 domain-containing protein [Stenotrophomonas sp. YIM B06876]|uniref:DUF4124 domain-containing protein n=1 Tax=Stenotrophomonas sp. YIM B06876 TaxID=3060211 RepID=UPI002738C6F8|nr:DUF4124 domain-containing protein [Stenotrophomonas sp. YIM B06876]